MNNKLLFLNTDNIDGIVLLDEACDPPDFANWDPSVGEGEIPLVVYEALDDFCFAMESNGMSDEDVLSPMFMNYMKDIAKQYKWTEDDKIKKDLMNRSFRSHTVMAAIAAGWINLYLNL